jgi:hypothetical protein
MLKRTEDLEDLDRRWERHVYGELSFHEALRRFAALWQQARALHAEPGRDWRADLEADLAIARALNDLPPA